MTVELLRFRHLAQYGVHNWPTLTRWIKEEGFPPGFYLASNTRAWHKSNVDAWLANRPPAGPPPENATAAKTPVPAGAAAGAINASAGKPKHPTHKRIDPACQASPTEEAA